MIDTYPLVLNNSNIEEYKNLLKEFNNNSFKCIFNLKENKYYYLENYISKHFSNRNEIKTKLQNSFVFVIKDNNTIYKIIKYFYKFLELNIYRRYYKYINQTVYLFDNLNNNYIIRITSTNNEYYLEFMNIERNDKDEFLESFLLPQYNEEKWRFKN